MKTQTFTQKNAVKTLGLFTLFTLMMLAFNPVVAQSTERVVKGIVYDEYGPMANASVYLKGSNIGTDSNAKGEFTFPKLLKENDILVVQHLGYEKVEVTIGPDTNFIEVTLEDYQIVIIGALKIGNNKSPSKSKN